MIDLNGQRFGRLTAILPSFSSKGHMYWLCKCDCGHLTTVVMTNLKAGLTKSCGCLSCERTVERSTIHGHAANRRGTRV